MLFGVLLVAVPVLYLAGLLIAAKVRARKEAAAEAAALMAKAEENRRKAEERRLKAEESRRAICAKEAAQRKAKYARRAAQEERNAAKLEAARQLAEYRERALAAARELKAMEQENACRNDPESSSAVAPKMDGNPPETTTAGKADNDPKPFSGYRVSFTGTLKSMKRAQAAEMVRLAGGKAYEKDMPVGTNLLVVGDTKGNNTRKLDKADEWIGQIKKITEAQFLAMLKAA